MQKMTDVESKVFEAWAQQMPGIKVETHLDFIRERMKHLAYHEAGHAAAAAFFGDDHGHFKEITIVPNSDRLGVFMQEWIFRPPLSNSSKLDWLRGKRQILFCLAGRAAEKRINGDIDAIGEEVLNGWEGSLCESEEHWRAGTDEGKALTVAEQISKPGWPPLRILAMIEAWVDELMDLPAIWTTVETIAQRLLSKGNITDFNEYDDLVSGILYQWPIYGVWKKRFWITEAEIVEDCQQANTNE